MNVRLGFVMNRIQERKPKPRGSKCKEAVVIGREAKEKTRKEEEVDVSLV